MFVLVSYRTIPVLSYCIFIVDGVDGCSALFLALTGIKKARDLPFIVGLLVLGLVALYLSFSIQLARTVE